MEKNILANLKRVLFFSLGVTAIAVMGFPLLFIGLANHWIPMWAIGIGCLGEGFYAMPLVWVFYGGVVTKKRLHDAVIRGERSVSDLARLFGKKEKDIVILLKNLMTQGYLTGYKFNAASTEIIEVERQGDTVRVKCGDCGAVMIKTSDGFKCEFCGAEIKYK